MSKDKILPLNMPKWGLAMTEGTVVGWLAAEGDTVAGKEEIVEIETEKITNVFEAPESGILRRQVIPVGEKAAVGALIGVIAPRNVSDEDIAAFVDEFQAGFVPPEAEQTEEEAAGQSLECGGYTISYRVEGKDHDRMPAVLIHGFGGDSNNWLFNLQVLAEERPVYVLDLPGHGKSTKTLKDASLDAFTGVAAAFIDALGLPRVHLAGHSLGAAICFAMLARSPDKVASAAGLAPAGVGEDINIDFIDGFVAAGRRKELKAVLQNLFADPGLVSREMVEGVQRYKRLEGANEALAAIAAANFVQGKQAARFGQSLSRASCPVMVIWGRDDKVIDPAQADALPANVVTHLLDAIGHMPHMEAASRVNTLLNDHFRDAEG